LRGRKTLETLMRQIVHVVAAAVEEPTPRGIAAAIARLITSGELAPGDRLPTVRELAAELGVSPATVSHAWQTLAAAGLIVSRGRSGSFVRFILRDWLPQRYRGLEGGREAPLDLSRGTPDPELLPPVGPAFARLARRNVTMGQEPANYQAKPDVPPLHDLLRETWPAPVESLTVTNGALDAIDRSLAALARLGDRIVLENPTFPPFLDLAEIYGLDVLPVPVDDEGLQEEAFARALARGPALVLLQPRAQNPTGVSMSAERAERLATLIARARVDPPLVIEDDHSGAISSAPETTLAHWLPERVLHVRSYSKSHSPDLRIGALGGPRPFIDRVVARRLLGPGWTSRWTQVMLHEVLADPVAVAQVEKARLTYAERQRAMAEALTAAGVPTAARDGLNMWLEVADERSAIVQLAAAGIRVAPGSPFQSGEPEPRVRVTVGMVPAATAPDIAAALAAAARVQAPSGR